MAKHYLACDLGADGGRLMWGALDNGKMTVEELHRFPNGPVKTSGALHWNIDALFNGLKTGLKKAAALNLPFEGISSSSWGLDYVLLDERGLILPPVWCYRDSRTACGVENVRAVVDWPTTFAETGVQFMAINTIYQLAVESPERLARAKQLLLIGNAFNYFLSGVAKNEVSLASTTQLYNPNTKTWSKKLLAALKLREDLFAPVCPSGTKLGPMKKNLATEVGLPPIEVIASCSHDTGAAVAAVPAIEGNWAYVISGPWSLIGVEWPKPVINDQARSLGFTNEIGFGDSVRLLKNIVGLWIVQECNRQWEKKGKKYSFEEIEQLAASSPPFVSLIDPNDQRFVSPDDMPEKIAAFCEDTGQPVPANHGAYVRCIYESLALSYRATLRRLERLTGKKIQKLHIVGAGSRNRTLNQFAANALKIPVITGPAECTALGNILVQAIALGHLPSLATAREVVRNSFELETVTPQDISQWDAAAVRFEKLLS